MLPLSHTSAEGLAYAELRSFEELKSPPSGVDILTMPGASNGFYVAGFAVSPRAIDRALKLRFEVFNLELGEGLMASRESGMDRDAFDDQMDHLIVVERSTDRIVGTYRMQVAAKALAGIGLYSASEYDLGGLGPYLSDAIELGRACIAKDHRSFESLFLLWNGISGYVKASKSRYLFGCCSLTTTDPDEGWRAMKTIRSLGALQKGLLLPAVEACSCGPAAREFDPTLGPGIKLPKLFNAYVRIGTKVISEPALDREFGTVDFLVMLDIQTIKPSAAVLDPLLRKLVGARRR